MDTDDFEIDDILGKDRKKRLNSGRKGKRVERDLVKVLNVRFGGGFSRTVGSGNRLPQVGYLPQHAKDTFCGDLVCPVDFAFVFESKGGYEEVDLCAAMDGGNATLDGFLKQADLEAVNTGRKPILAWKKNRKPWLAFLKTQDLPHTDWEYRLIYREWSAVPLTILLQEDNSYFYLKK